MIFRNQYHRNISFYFMSNCVLKLHQIKQLCQHAIKEGSVMKLGFIGFGEVGFELGRGLRQSGLTDI